MKSPDCNPRWARSPWTTNCCPPRSPPWRPKALWPEGGRDDEPDGLAFHVSFLWPGAGLARMERFARRRVSLSQGNACDPRRPGPCPDADLADHIRWEIEACPTFMAKAIVKYGATARCRRSLEPSPRAPDEHL